MVSSRLSYSHCHLGLFAKYWTPGEVKTRLAATLGTRAASQVHRVLLKWTLNQLASAGVDRRVLVYAPRRSRGTFRRHVHPHWRMVPQGSGDLGRRLRLYCRQALASGAGRVVVVGSDAPLLAPAHVRQAVQRLEENHVVLGPARDGGYYLAAMRGDRCAIFDRIDWSTAATLEQTLDRARQHGWRCALLETLVDIDRGEDLQWTLDYLDLHREADPIARQLRAELLEASLGAPRHSNPPRLGGVPHEQMALRAGPPDARLGTAVR